jgi:hypothetical protein
MDAACAAISKQEKAFPSYAGVPSTTGARNDLQNRSPGRQWLLKLPREQLPNVYRPVMRSSCPYLYASFLFLCIFQSFLNILFKRHDFIHFTIILSNVVLSFVKIFSV